MSFNVALSGLNAARSNLSATGNNIANVNTTGFKGSRAEFADIFAASSSGINLNQVGSGVRLSGMDQQFSQGAIEFTDNSLDLAINGDGFFTLSDGGQRVYSRAGAFGLDRDGFIENSSGHRLLAHPPNGQGGFNAGSLGEIRITNEDNPPAATTRMTIGANLPSITEPPPNATFAPDDINSFSHTTSMTVYDSLGAAQVATLYFVKAPVNNEWTVHSYVDGQQVSAPAGDALVFGDDGQLQQPANQQLALPGFNLGNGAQDQALTLDLSEMTQFANGFSTQTLQQDGFTTGRLVGVEISQDGVLFARYTNGQAEPLGQISLTQFSNPQGLQQLGNTAWAESFESGQPVVGTANSSSFGQIQAGALESSNVNLSEQLVNMIVAQRNFQANAQMIQTEDQVMQTVINIR